MNITQLFLYLLAMPRKIAKVTPQINFDFDKRDARGYTGFNDRDAQAFSEMFGAEKVRCGSTWTIRLV